jgi:hypothetical protein
LARNRLLRLFARGFGLLFATIPLLFVVELLVWLTAPPVWLEVLFIVAAAVPLVLGFCFWLRAVARDQREWIRTGYQRPSQLPAPAPSAQPATTKTDVVVVRRTPGMTVLLLCSIALLGVPTTCAGAVWHVRWLVNVGIAMLVVTLVVNAVILPAIRVARR